MVSSCKKDGLSNNKPQGKYTVQGKVLFDTTLQPYKNTSVELYVTRGAQSTFVYKTLGTAVTNDSGWFSITYDATDVTGDDGGGANPAQVHLSSQWFIYDNLPVNQNINRTFIKPVAGTLQVYLQTSNPLETKHDTLYLAYYQMDKSGNDILTILSVTNTVNGLYKSLRVQPYGFTMFYGRGWKDFAYGHPRGGAKYIDTNIDGDPTIDKMTINY